MLGWLFPTAQEPASLAAGSMLQVRVQLPTALTPPPGVQQPKALERWAGVLQARARRVDGAGIGDVRYALAVTDVRPEATSTLAYRATLPLPAWVAPGAYALTLATPGGALGPTPVHVWEPGAHSEPSRDVGDGATSLVVASGRAPIAVMGGRVAWYPAGSLDASEVPPVIGVVHETSASTAPTFRVQDASALAPTLRLPADGRVRAGDAVELAVEGIAAGTRVAWRIGERAVAWGPGRIEHAFVAGGREEVIACVVSADGRAALVRGSVRVAATAGHGCAVSGPPALGAGSGWVLFLAVAAASKSARRRSGWNRLRRDGR